MGRILTSAELSDLPVDERLDLIEALWDSLARDTMPVPDWHITELDRRLAAHQSDPSGGTPWLDVRDRVIQRYKK